ncbi:MAG: zinc-dependent metalloprotease [Saprospiraceae bacterium]|nr:zinc-dependent metalloprotease [Saprospiraceae bacterium]
MNLIFRPLLFFVLLLPVFSYGQTTETNPCATRDGKSDWLIQYQQNPQHFPNLADTLYVPLTMHLVGDNSGFGYFNYKLLLEIICRLNQDFAPAAIQFYVKGDINYIANSSYNEHNWDQGAEMMQLNRVDNTINCYIVDDPAGACGYSAYNLGVALKEDCIGINDHTWAHELGHYLSLPHTFYGWEGTTYDYAEPAPVQLNNNLVERLDGSNCNVAGDGFCDTPADYLNYRWNCYSNGFSQTEQHDPSGEAFFSDGSFYMSYALDDCMDRFSDDQMDAMRANLLTEKLDYLYQDDILGPISATPFNVIFPEDGAVVDNYNSITFEWEPIPNATNYFVEFSPFPNFTLVLFKYEVTESQVVSTEIPPNYTLYWRVRPYNFFHTCVEWTEGKIFSTGDVTSVNTLTGLEQLQLSPVPITSGESLRLEFQLEEGMDLQLDLLDVSGKKQRSLMQSFDAGSQLVHIPTSGLSAGIYVLRLHGKAGSISRKLVIVR